MCGIAGVIDLTGRPVSQQALTAARDALAHRGPDDAGVFVDGSVGLAHRRLSIIDIAGGHQPMSNREESVWIVYNGELYNFRELRRELEQRGCRFRTQSDTEVVLGAYETWGVTCVERFNGIFAFGIWDRKRRRLFLARDHLGVKPLYYYSGGRKVVFASELKAILDDAGIERELDLKALDFFLTYRYVPSPWTLFKGIQKLAPGSRLVLEEGGARVERYWNYVPQVDLRRDERETVLQFRQRFEQAVRRQMVSDVPVGLMLSGGIDSGVLLAVMSRYSSDPIQTFTVGFQGETAANELEEARETAKLFGAEHREVVVGAMEYRDFLPRVLWHLEEPLSTTSILPFYYVAELAGRHVKVALSGQGADESFAGYNRYRGEKLGTYFRKLPSALRRPLCRAASWAPLRSETLRRAGRALGVEDPPRRFVEVYAVFSTAERRRLYRPEVAEALAGSDPVEAIAPLQRQVAHLDTLAQMLYVDTRLWLPDDLLLYGDKLSMAHSLEVRVPFLDVEFLEFVETIPSHLKLHGMRGKYIHKKAMATWLPPQIVRRKKKGFATPMDRWLQTDLTGYVREVLLDPGAGCQSYLCTNVVDEMIRQHASGRANLQRQIFALLTFELWHRIFLAGKDA